MKKHTPLAGTLDATPLRDIYAKLAGKTLHSEDEIVAASVAAPKLCGVYFLIKNKRVVYVGQSISVWNRISIHAGEGKSFDRAAFIACEKKHLDILEALYIHVFRPSLNGNVSPSGVKAAQLGFHELLDKLTQMLAYHDTLD